MTKGAFSDDQARKFKTFQHRRANARICQESECLVNTLPEITLNLDDMKQVFVGTHYSEDRRCPPGEKAEFVEEDVTTF